MTAKHGKDPGAVYGEITKELGESFYDRVEATASTAQKEKLGQLSAGEIKNEEVAGEKIIQILTTAPGNQASIGGVKVTTENGWFAARPSGTEDIYKIYAESFLNQEHLQRILDEAQTMVDGILQHIH